jgi:hypothetical protein
LLIRRLVVCFVSVVPSFRIERRGTGHECVRGRLYAGAEGSRETAAPERLLQALLVVVDVGAATAAAPFGVEDRAAAGLERQAHELGLRRPRAAAATGP